MGMGEYERAIEIIAQHPERADFSGPKELSLIERAEARLGVSFPPTYRRFLMEFGAGSFGASEFYGVTGPVFDTGSIPQHGLVYASPQTGFTDTRSSGARS